MEGYMGFSKISGDLTNLQQISKFLREEGGTLGDKGVTVEVKGKTFGGREVVVNWKDDTTQAVSFKMNELVDHVAKKAAADATNKSADLEHLKLVVTRLLAINDKSNVQGSNPIQRLLTTIRQLLGNIGFNKEKILHDLESDYAPKKQGPTTPESIPPTTGPKNSTSSTQEKPKAIEQTMKERGEQEQIERQKKLDQVREEKGKSPSSHSLDDLDDLIKELDTSPSEPNKSDTSATKEKSPSSHSLDDLDDLIKELDTSPQSQTNQILQQPKRNRPRHILWMT